MKSAPLASEDRRLMVLVRRSPVIYDAGDPRYLDTPHKNGVWQRIAGELGMTETQCRSRWCNIRNNYRKSLVRNRLKRRAGRAPRPYKYMRDMAFLKPYFTHLEAHDPLSDPDEGGEDDDSALSPEELAAVSKRERSESPSSCADAAQSSCDDAAPAPAQSTCADAAQSWCEDAAPAQSWCEDAASAQSWCEDVAPAQSTCEDAAPASPQPSHPVDAFLACIESTLKALPPYLLSLAKGEIFTTVQKYELRMLRPSDSGHASASDASQALDEK